MITHKILCEICDHPLARAHLPELRRPLIAAMFYPVEPGFDQPFPDPDATWQWMKCPMCKARPFIVSEEQASMAVDGNWPGPEQVKTDKGVYTIYSHAYPGVPPQINIQIHSDEDLEKEWQARAKKTPATKEATKATKDTKNGPSDTALTPQEKRKARRQGARKK